MGPDVGEVASSALTQSEWVRTGPWEMGGLKRSLQQGRHIAANGLEEAIPNSHFCPGKVELKRSAMEIIATCGRDPGPLTRSWLPWHQSPYMLLHIVGKWGCIYQKGTVFYQSGPLQFPRLLLRGSREIQCHWPSYLEVKGAGEV